MQLASAAGDGDLLATRQLIEDGFDVNEFSHDGMTPLSVAAFWGHEEIVRELLQAGADVNACNIGTLWTPLHCAAFQGHGKVIMTLMEHSPDLYTADCQGRTAIDFASVLDSIWSFFHAAGCKRTPKADLFRMDIIKVSSPGEEGKMHSTSMEPEHLENGPNFKASIYDRTMAYASVTGDVLAGMPDVPMVKNHGRGPLWEN